MCDYEQPKIMIKPFRLPNGNSMPMLALGTYLANDKEPLMNAIKTAIEYGYRHFDLAWIYDNEEWVGKAIWECINDSNGTLKREDLFLTSKLWCTFHSQDLVESALKETLDHLRTDYLDMYLIHWPMGMKENTGPFPKDSEGNFLYSNVDYLDTWKGMEEVFKEGMVKNIGLSNFNMEQVRRVLNNCSVPPVVNQIEVNPYVANCELVDFCQENDVAIMGYAPFGASKTPEGHDDVPILVEHPVLIKIGKKHNKTPAQVCLRWSIQRDIIVLPKSVHRDRVISNAQVFDFTLSDDEMDEIYNLDLNARSCTMIEFIDHKLYPFEELKQQPRREDREE